MSWREALDRALDHAGDGDTLEIGRDGTSQAEVDVEQVGPIGVRVGRVRLTHGTPRAPSREAERLVRDVRALPHALTPVEADDTLGGAVLRSEPSELGDDDFFEVDVRGDREVEVRHYDLADGERTASPWDATRDQLGRLLEQLDRDP